MLIKEFLNNPMGKGTSLNIGSIKSEYSKRYQNISNRLMHLTLSIKNDIYIVVKIPSSVDGIFYDVVVKFIYTNKSVGNSIFDRDIQIFSNSPSFLYTYANAYLKRNLFIKELRKKLSSKILKDIAETKNPYGLISYDFSVYAALYYIVNSGNFHIVENSNNSINDLYRIVSDADNLQKNRKKQNDYLRELKRQQDKIKKKINNSDKYEPITIKSVKENKKVKTGKKVSNVKKTKRR